MHEAASHEWNLFIYYGSIKRTTALYFVKHNFLRRRQKSYVSTSSSSSKQLQEEKYILYS